LQEQRALERLKLRAAMPILNDDLAIDDCRAVKLGCCLRYAWIALGPIEAIAGIGTCFATSMIRRVRHPSCLTWWIHPARGVGGSAEVASCGLMNSRGMQNYLAEGHK